MGDQEIDGETTEKRKGGPNLGKGGMEGSDWCLIGNWMPGEGEGTSIMSRIEP